ncbi:MAG: carbon-nitrogen hydrolase family protein [bacterium]|nr:carbon-nitrogen hydrolase family protein [bacterium]
MTGTGKHPDRLKVALAQIAPVWLDRERTLIKVLERIEEVGSAGCDLVAFGEAAVPGYPFWIERTGAEFDSPVHKELHALYLDQAVQVEAGHLTAVCEQARRFKVAVYLGLVERPADRGGHSLYCSLAHITRDGEIASLHRKLMPTHDERLTWSPGDGNGLRTHPLGAFTVGGLNCWENWMPLPRAALYGLGEDLHVAVWPGGPHNTREITPFIAREGRSYVMSVSCVTRPEDFPPATPHRDTILARGEKLFAAGGSCLAGPDGNWLIEPLGSDETLVTAEIDHRRIREERQNFDPAGHYSRPDVTRLHINRRRQSTVSTTD